MKKINKIIAITGIFLSAGLLFAAKFPEEDENEQISLPDLTTVVTADTLTAGMDVMPDFADVVELPSESAEIQPQLPEVQVEEKVDYADAGSGSADKSIYAEGNFGGGYPNLFIGNFSIYRMDGNSPFNLNFNHNSISGFANNSQINGYFSRQTAMAVDKQINLNEFSLDFGGAYKTIGDGFQNKVQGVSDINSNTVEGCTKLNYELPYGFNIGADFDMNLYDRYLDITNTGSVSYAKNDWLNPELVLGISPKLYAGWTGYGFTLNFTGSYWYDKDFSKNLSVFETSNISENTSSHRGEFLFGLNWKYNDFEAHGNVAAVIGNQLNGNGYVVPFNLGLDYAFPVYFSNRKISLSLDGGLESYRNSICELENKYKYAAVNVMPGETSNWYGNFAFSLPLKQNFTGAFKVGYKHSAFDNGVWMPSYLSDDLINGMYLIKNTQQNALSTDFEITYHRNIVSMTIGWHSNWLDVPALESSQMMKMMLSFQSLDSKFGINIYGDIFFGDVSNTELPVLGLEGFIRITPALRLVVSADDVIQLFSNKTRMYAGQYAAKGGSASVTLKFFF